MRVDVHAVLGLAMEGGEVGVLLRVFGCLSNPKIERFYFILFLSFFGSQDF